MSEKVKIKIEELDSNEKKIFFEISWNTFVKEYKIFYQRFTSKLKFNGFRSGKIPYTLLKKYYKYDVNNEIILNIINKYCSEFVEVKNLIPIGKPKINYETLQENKSFCFSVVLNIAPNIILDSIKDYKNLEFEENLLDINNIDIENKIEKLRSIYGDIQSIPLNNKIKCKIGDFLVIDFVGKINGKIIKSLQANNFLLELGKNQISFDFDSKLIGYKIGEKLEFSLNLVKNNNNKLIEEKVDFVVLIKSIKYKKNAILNKKFLKKIGNYSNLDQLKFDIRIFFQKEIQKQNKLIIQEKIIEKLLKDNNFEIPEILIQNKLQVILSELQTMGEFPFSTEISKEKQKILMEKLKNKAEKQVKIDIILDFIAKKENISVSINDLQQILMKIKLNHHVENQYKNIILINILKTKLIQQKTLDFLIDQVKIKSVKN